MVDDSVLCCTGRLLLLVTLIIFTCEGPNVSLASRTKVELIGDLSVQVSRSPKPVFFAYKKGNA